MVAAQKMPVIPMTLNQLESFLVSLPKTANIELDTFTVPEIVGNCPFPNVFKITTRLVEVGEKLNYKNRVRTNQIVEGHNPNFVPQKPNYGTKISGTPFQEHKGKIYLPCIVLATYKCSYVNDKFKPIPMNLIEPFLRKTSEVKSQPTSKKEIYRKYLLESILAVRYNQIELKAV